MRESMSQFAKLPAWMATRYRRISSILRRLFEQRLAAWKAAPCGTADAVLVTDLRSDA